MPLGAILRERAHAEWSWGRLCASRHARNSCEAPVTLGAILRGDTRGITLKAILRERARMELPWGESVRAGTHGMAPEAPLRERVRAEGRLCASGRTRNNPGGALYFTSALITKSTSYDFLGLGCPPAGCLPAPWF